MSLVSHVSTDSSIVRFQTIYEDRPYAQIYYLAGSLTDAVILSTLRADTITVHYRNGKTGKVLNPFKFPREGKTVNTSEN